MAKLLLVTENHTSILDTEETDWLRKRLADSTDLTTYFDTRIFDAEPDYTVYLDGQQIHTTITGPTTVDETPATTQAPVGGMDALQQLDMARHRVIKAALHLAAIEWANGRETADGSADLDYAHDQFDTALHDYATAHEANSTVPVPFYPAVPVTTERIEVTKYTQAAK